MSEHAHAQHRRDRHRRTVVRDRLDHAGEHGRRRGRDPVLPERVDLERSRKADEAVSIALAVALRRCVDADEATDRAVDLGEVLADAVRKIRHGEHVELIGRSPALDLFAPRLRP